MRESIERALIRHTPLGDRHRRKRLIAMRRGLFERLGSARYSRPAMYGLDDKLASFLPEGEGVFVEAGANDGWTDSNTYYLEAIRGWTGVLVEGIPELAEECRRQRPRSSVFNCALADESQAGETVTMRYGDRVSLVSGALGSRDIEDRHLGAHHPLEDSYEVNVPARTLTDVLTEAGVGAIDFMSLDLEGSEPAALRGFDMDRFSPDWLLVESLGHGEPAITSIVEPWYEKVSQLTRDDVLYRAHARPPS